MRTFVFCLFVASFGCGGNDDGAGPPADAANDTFVSDTSSPPIDASVDVAREAEAEVGADAPMAPCGDPAAAPVVGKWRTLSTSGLPVLVGTAVWTGTEAVIVNWSSTKRSVAAYDPTKDSWRSIAVDATAPSARDNPYIGFAGGRVWLWGGHDSAGSVATGGSLDPKTGAWSAMTTTGAPALPYLVTYSPRAFELAGKVVFVPAHADKGQPALGVYDTATNTWSTVTSTTGENGCNTLTWSPTHGACDHLGEMFELTTTSTPFLLPRGSSFFTDWYPTFVGETLYSWGGANDITSNPTYVPAVYDFSARTWTNLPEGPVARGGALVGAIGEKLLIWGGVGYASASTTTVRHDGAVFDPASKTWSAMPCAGAPTDSSVFSAYAFTGTDLLVFGSKAWGYSL